MGPRETPQKSIFWSQKWHFPDFLFRGSVEGRGGCNPGVTNVGAFGSWMSVLKCLFSRISRARPKVLPQNVCTDSPRDIRP